MLSSNNPPRPSERQSHELREITFERDYTKHAEGSVLVSFGHTKVICNASIIKGVPRWLKGKGQGWITAEYGMLPRATIERTNRESLRGQPAGRTLEIQRLIGRTLRAAVELNALGENTIHVDTDVIQADGGTRTAAISGACVALVDAFSKMLDKGLIQTNPLQFLIAAVSVGIYNDMPILDLDYAEDSNASTDMNIVMSETGKFIEIQGTAEKTPFHNSELIGMLELAKSGTETILSLQRKVLDIN